MDPDQPLVWRCDCDRPCNCGGPPPKRLNPWSLKKCDKCGKRRPDVEPAPATEE